ncbi:MAG: DUF1848 domain-containing protein [Eubacterium sp.]|nr:DUF1848 domain-containing protein [Eubacterium sp.]
MIINTGQRTDIPAYYSEWFYNRIKEGYVLVRNPYYPEQVTRYELKPEVVDVLAFCTKNPAPMLDRLEELSAFRQFWFVTITPYGRDIEPNVPPKENVVTSFCRLSEKVGKRCVGWRYDPILIAGKYTVDYHIQAFEGLTAALSGYTDQAVISFVDLYQKTKRNFPQAREVTKAERAALGKAFAETGKRYGITVRTCCEGTDLAVYGIDTQGCMTKEVLEKALGEKLTVPVRSGPRPQCSCLLGNDIGVYNTCRHFCRYCYANYDRKTVLQNVARHRPDSPFLIGEAQPGDKIRKAKQSSFISDQLTISL